MSRKANSNGAKLDKHDKDIFELKQKCDCSKQEYEKHIERHIKDDLMQERFPGSGKSLYSYNDIADRYDVSTSKVQRVAEDNSLTRRNKNIG